VNSSRAELAVLERADALIAAFGAHDRDRYFAFFDPAATFLFHTGPFLGSRPAYEAEWARWEAGGFHVLACASSDRRADEVADDVVVFTHRVRTRVRDGRGSAAQEAELDERETILFRRGPGGEWTGVHEHLSPTPDGASTEQASQVSTEQA
jgi:ketosteroid isomerase-like protein